MALADSFSLKSTQFRKERERSWRELDRVLEQIRAKGIENIAAKDLQRLPGLYRGVVSSLSVARAISLDKNLLDYLEALASRAYILVYTEKKPPKAVAKEYLISRFPRAVYAYRWYFFLSLILVGLGALCGFGMTLSDQERYYSFVPVEMAGDRTPESTTESLRDVLYTTPADSGGLTLFASFLFTHNAKIGVLCFCLGFVAGVPVVLLLFYNGLLLGSMTALYSSRGLGGEFLAWVLQHGVTELSAVCLCGAAGLVVGRAILFPGRWTRVRSLAADGRAIAPIVLCAVLMFLVAGLLEGYARQLVTSVPVRWMLASGSLAFWSWYFFRLGRKEHEKESAEA